MSCDVIVPAGTRFHWLQRRLTREDEALLIASGFCADCGATTNLTVIQRKGKSVVLCRHHASQEKPS